MDKIKIGLSIFLGVLATFAEKYGAIILLVAIVVLLDVLTGLIKAKIIGEKWESRKGTIGFFKKIALLLALCFGIFLDFFIPYILKTGVSIVIPFKLPFGLIVGIYIITNECISICENLYQCNPKIIPKWIAKLLKIASETIDNGAVKQHE